MNGNTALRRLEEQHAFLTENFGGLSGACKTTKELEKLKQAVRDASLNLMRARNRIFDENDSQVQTLVTELEDAESQVRNSLQQLENLGEVLNGIAKVVSLGAQLVSLGKITP